MEIIDIWGKMNKSILYDNSCSAGTNEIQNAFLDELRINGVRHKGYGIIPKIIMIDPILSIEAKALYAFFCSFSGGGSQLFPGREYILHFLKISKNVYYNALNELKDKGLVSVEQKIGEGGKFTNNIFTLESSPSLYSSVPDETNMSNAYHKVYAEGLLAAGYGFIPKAVMIDDSISFREKAMYAYICAFSGSGNTAFPSKSVILHQLSIGDSSYRSFIKVLVAHNYIRVVRKHENGKLAGNEYIIVDKPNSTEFSLKPEIKVIKNQGVEISDTVSISQSVEIQDTAIQDTVSQDAVIYDTKTNNYTNNNLKNNKDKIYSIAPEEKTVEEFVEDVCKIFGRAKSKLSKKDRGIIRGWIEQKIKLSIIKQAHDEAWGTFDKAKQNFNYVNGILKNWMLEGKTEEDIFGGSIIEPEDDLILRDMAKIPVYEEDN